MKRFGGEEKDVSTTRPRYSKEEFARRGDAMYESGIRSVVEDGNQARFVAIDIETGAYEADVDELAASDRLLARIPDAQVWLKGSVLGTLAVLGHAPDRTHYDRGHCHGESRSGHTSDRPRSRQRGTTN